MGTIGYTDDSRISRMWRDLRGNRIGGGTDEIMVYIAGRALLKEYQPK
jgi:alkylation response protein AidB-like acyl-CoA dehydrogenase